MTRNNFYTSVTLGKKDYQKYKLTKEEALTPIIKGEKNIWTGGVLEPSEKSKAEPKVESKTVEWDWKW